MIVLLVCEHIKQQMQVQYSYTRQTKQYRKILGLGNVQKHEHSK